MCVCVWEWLCGLGVPHLRPTVARLGFGSTVTLKEIEGVRKTDGWIEFIFFLEDEKEEDNCSCLFEAIHPSSIIVLMGRLAK